MTYDKLLENRNIIVIAGPTASGKTDLSLKLAKEMDSEIISADSRQLFKYLDIGTAKPTKEELNTVQHHFIDIVYPDEYYSAGVFGNQAYATALNIMSRGKVPIVVGGSGLYIKALCDGLFDADSNNSETNTIRYSLESRLKDEGVNVLYDELFTVDEKSAVLYKEKNPRRIIRALEYYYSTGKVFSESHRESAQERNINPIYFVINRDREELYDRINLRSEIMWKSGIIDETEKVLNMGYSKEFNSLNTVGYKEVIAFLNNEMTEDEALNKMKQTTRNYAKRQVTWFKRINSANLCHSDDENLEMILKKV